MEQDVRRLRDTLRVNALLSGAAGLLCATAAGPVADLLGTGHTGAVRVVGLGLMVFALDLALLARARPARLAAGATLVAVADEAWTVGMVVLVAAGAFEPVGAGIALATGVMTALFAWLEWTLGASLRRKSGRSAPRMEAYA